MLAHRYPPYNAVESTRPAMFAKYLGEFGWQPLVVCAEDAGESCDDRRDEGLIPESLRYVVTRVPATEMKPPDRIVKDAGRRLRRLFSRLIDPPPDTFISDVWDGFRWVLDNLMPERNPWPFTRNLARALPALIEEHRPEVIWASALPSGTHTAAAQAARRYGIPWVADYRDVLEQQSIRAMRQTRLQWRWWRRRETRVGRSASAVVMVSPALAETLERRLARPVQVIPNGFDPDQYPLSEPTLDETFTLTYTGTVLIPQSDPQAVLAALDDLIATGDMSAEDLSVRFYGRNSELVRSLAAGRRCEDCVRALPLVPRRDCHAIQQRSQVLLQLAHASERGIMTSKIFEYLGAGRPILSVPRDNDCVDALLAETGAGVACSPGEPLRRTLLEWYRQWKITGAVQYTGRPDAIAKYSRRHQAGMLAEILDRVTAQPSIR